MEFTDHMALDNILDAFDILEQMANTHHQRTDIVLQRARYAALRKDNNNGILSDSQYKTMMARIRVALFDIYYGMDTSLRGTGAKVQQTSQRDSRTAISTLQKVIRENKRRRPKLAEAASILLQRYRDYDDQKSMQPSWDPSGRRKKVLDSDFVLLSRTLREAKASKLETTVDRIAEALLDVIPTYGALQEAYDLLQGVSTARDAWIETQLTNRPDLDDTRISVAERIEELMTKIQSK